MRKITTVAVIPLFAGCLWAQSNNQATQTETTTVTKTTYAGTLVDAACRTKATERKETTTDANSTTTKTETTTEVMDCPVTTTTTSFGLIAPGGKYVRFDEPSNSRIVEIVKTNKKWNKFVSERAPVKVRVVGTPNGDMVVMESIE